jgi:hypothetical protein
MGGSLALSGEDGQSGTRFRLDLPAAEPGGEPVPPPGPATAGRAHPAAPR